MADAGDRVSGLLQAAFGAKTVWSSSDPEDRLALYKAGSGAVLGVVANPNRPPRIIHLDGSIEDLVWFD